MSLFPVLIVLSLFFPCLPASHPPCPCAPDQCNLTRHCLSSSSLLRLSNGAVLPASALHPSDTLVGLHGRPVTITSLQRGVSERLVTVTHVDGSRYTVTPEHLVTVMLNRPPVEVTRRVVTATTTTTTTASVEKAELVVRCFAIKNGLPELTPVHTRALVPSSALREPSSLQRHGEDAIVWHESQWQEYGEWWVSSHCVLHDSSSGCEPVDGSVLAGRGAMFEVRASALLTAAGQKLIAERVIVGYREPIQQPIKPTAPRLPSSDREALRNSIAIESVEPAEGGEIVSIEVDGDQRFQLAVRRELSRLLNRAKSRVVGVC